MITKEEIAKELKEDDFSKEELINKLSEEIQEYFEYKNSP